MGDNTSGRGKKQTLLGSVLTVAVILLLGGARLLEGGGAPGLGSARETNAEDQGGSIAVQASQAGVDSTLETILEEAQSADWLEDGRETEYSFRNERLLNQHYEKHGMEMGFATLEEYVEAANAVIHHPDALHKLEAEDNDDIYFLEATNEFVVVSTDGYIRTYFIASGGIDYFNRQ